MSICRILFIVAAGFFGAHALGVGRDIAMVSVGLCITAIGLAVSPK